jgi:hypothetical protein
MENGNGNGKVEKLDLVGTFESHLILGVERSRIARFLGENELGKDKIPEPITTRPLACGPVWFRWQIEERAARMYEAAGAPYGRGRAGLDRWVVERAVKRALALPKPLPPRELGAVIGRDVPDATYERIVAEFSAATAA